MQVEEETSSPSTDSTDALLVLWRSPCGDMDGDVVLHVGTKKIAVNKTYLGIYSPFFYRLFNNNFVECRTGKYEIKNVDEDDFIEMLLVLLPTRKPITELNVESLLILSDQFHIDTLRKDCIAFLRTAGEAIPTINILQLAFMYNSEELKTRCKELIRFQHQIAEIRDSEFYEILPVDAREFLFALTLKLPKLEHPTHRLLYTRPRVYFDISYGREPQGRIVMELFSELMPRTAENFRWLCTGEKGYGRQGRPLHYRGTLMDNNYRGCLTGGNLSTEFGGCTYESIYGDAFDDDSYVHRETGVGALAMLNERNENASRFRIYAERNWEDDGKYAVFGQVVMGLNLIRRMVHDHAWRCRLFCIADSGQLYSRQREMEYY